MEIMRCQISLSKQNGENEKKENIVIIWASRKIADPAQGHFGWSQGASGEYLVIPAAFQRDSRRSLGRFKGHQERSSGLKGGGGSWRSQEDSGFQGYQEYFKGLEDVPGGLSGFLEGIRELPRALGALQEDLKGVPGSLRGTISSRSSKGFPGGFRGRQ